MGDGPEEKKYCKTAGEGIHDIDCLCRTERVISENNNEEAAKQNKQRRTGRVGQLHFVARRNKFATIPEATSHFCSKYENERGHCTHDPSGNVVDFSKIHTRWLVYILRW